MGGVEDWAHKHSFNVKEIGFSLKMGRNIRGNLNGSRNGQPLIPVFSKSRFTALQAGDLPGLADLLPAT